MPCSQTALSQNSVQLSAGQESKPRAYNRNCRLLYWQEQGPLLPATQAAPWGGEKEITLTGDALKAYMPCRTGTQHRANWLSVRTEGLQSGFSFVFLSFLSFKKKKKKLGRLADWYWGANYTNSIAKHTLAAKTNVPWEQEKHQELLATVSWQGSQMPVNITLFLKKGTTEVVGKELGTLLCERGALTLTCKTCKCFLWLLASIRSLAWGMFAW